MKHERLWLAVAEVVRLWPAGYVEMLAEEVEAVSVPVPLLKSSLTAARKELQEAWIESGLPGMSLAAALRAAAFTADDLSKRERFDLVWTGPDTAVIPLRRTETVLCEVIDSARDDLTLVSFVAYEVPSVVAALRRATERQVEIRIVLEAPVAMGGSLDVDSVAKMRGAVPQARIYVWDSSGAVGIPGVIHAKCAAADGRIALVTSANLTGSAMWRNMELGVLVQGGRQPSRLRDHFDALIDTKVLVET